jgi:hypothetical protein
LKNRYYLRYRGKGKDRDHKPDGQSAAGVLRSEAALFSDVALARRRAFSIPNPVRG